MNDALMAVEDHYREETSGALKIIQKLIYEVEVDPESYEYVNDKLQKIVFENWHEKTKVNKHFAIDNFEGFADDLQDALNLPRDEYKELLMMHKRMQQGEVKHLEVRFDRGKVDTRYVFFAVSKRGNLTDMVYAIYVLDAREAPRMVKQRKQIGTVKKSKWWGLFKWEEPLYEESFVQQGLQLNTFGRLQQDPRVNAFFRYKALEGFANEGLVEKEKLKFTQNCPQLPMLTNS